MEQESRALSVLKRSRYLILSAMVIASLVSAFWRFLALYRRVESVLDICSGASMVYASRLCLPSGWLGCYRTRWSIEGCEPCRQGTIGSSGAGALLIDVWLRRQ